MNMGNCPFCGAELGFGIAICPNCGSQIQGDSLTDDGHHGDIGGDVSSDTIDGGSGQDTITGGQGGQPGPEVGEVEEVADGWVADDVVPNEPIEVDSGVPGSEIPPSRGGGFQQQGEDGVAPRDVISPPEVDRQPDDIPGRPGKHPDPDDSTGRSPSRSITVFGIAAILMIVMIALAGWYLLGDDDGNGNGNGNGNGEPNGNGDDPLEGLHLHKEGTSGTYPYEPPGEYHITVALRNNGSKSVDLEGHDISVTIWIDWKVKGQEVHDLSGSIGAGETKTYDIVVDTELLGGNDELFIGITLRKNGGDSSVHTINYEQTL